MDIRAISWTWKDSRWISEGDNEHKSYFMDTKDSQWISEGDNGQKSYFMDLKDSLWTLELFHRDQELFMDNGMLLTTSPNTDEPHM